MFALLLIPVLAEAVGPDVGTNCTLSWRTPADTDVVQFHYEVGTGVPGVFTGPVLATPRRPVTPNSIQTVQCPPGITAGQKSVRVRAQDAVGNIGAWVEAPFFVDATSPGAVTELTVLPAP